MITGVLPTMVSLPIAVLALIVGLCMFVISPRLANHTAPAYGPVTFSDRLVMRWLCLFGLNVFATTCIYIGMITGGLVAPLPLLAAVGSILAIAFLLSCVLSSYL